MSDTSSYKELLLKARELRGKAGVNAWQRAKLLCQVFDDSDFRDSIGAVDDWKAAEALDAETEDLCLTFLQLRQVFIVFPNKSDWSDGRLRSLYEKASENSKPEADEDEPKRIVNRVTKKEFEQVQQEKTEAVARAKYADTERTRLSQEVEELKSENQLLRSRIQELERLVKLEGVAA